MFVTIHHFRNYNLGIRTFFEPIRGALLDWTLSKSYLSLLKSFNPLLNCCLLSSSIVRTMVQGIPNKTSVNSISNSQWIIILYESALFVFIAYWYSILYLRNMLSKSKIFTKDFLYNGIRLYPSIFKGGWSNPSSLRTYFSLRFST